MGRERSVGAKKGRVAGVEREGGGRLKEGNLIMFSIPSLL